LGRARTCACGPRSRSRHVAGRTRRKGLMAARPSPSRRPPEPPPDHPRLFVATPLDEAAHAAVVGLVEDVQRSVAVAARDPRSEVRWVRMDGLHITVRFLGAT